MRVSMGLVILLAAALPTIAKVEVDFNPSLDFSQFKTYAYIGGTEEEGSPNRNKRNERPERPALQGSRDGGGNQSWTILAVLQ